MSMLSEFKEFALKGNVMDLAVGVIIGAAFGKIIDSFVADIVMPIIQKFWFSSKFHTDKFVALSEVPAGTAATLAAHKAAGVNTLAYGNFITSF